MRKPLIVLVTLFAVALMALTTGSCKKSSAAPCSANWASSIQDESNALTNAILIYSQNPTTANCEAYKQAYSNYLNALKDWGNCVGTGAQTQEWKDAIKDAEDEIQNIAC